jgi:hypothetical protein
MLDKKLNNNLLFILLLIGLAILSSIVIGNMQQNAISMQNFVDDVNEMNCDELLSEIKAAHIQSNGYWYVETWIEKECWK